MSKMYIIAVRWVDTNIVPERVDQTLDSIGDWFRYNGSTWFVWTDATPREIRARLSTVLSVNDGILVMGANARELDGFAPQQFWDWISEKRRQLPLAQHLVGRAFGPAQAVMEPAQTAKRYSE